MHGRIKACGFSLIELMISIAIGLLILAGMIAVFANTNASRNEIDRTNRQIENGRYALELLRDDLQLAGFYGEINWGNFTAPSNVPPAPLPTAMPDPCATVLTERTNGGTPGVLRLHVQGVDNYIAGGLSCLTGANVVKPGTDVIILRRAKTCTAGAANCDAFDANKPYLQVSLCSNPPASASSTKTHALALGSDTLELVHKLKNCTTDAPKRPYVIYMYFVGTDNVLKRAEFTGAGMGTPISLVDGIENLQVEYGIDTNNDGNADSYEGYLGDPTLAATVIKWSDVVTVKINLLARNPEMSPGYTDTKTYNLGVSGGNIKTDAGNDVPTTVVSGRTIYGPWPTTDPNDKDFTYRRHVYTSLVRIQNVSARRETP